MERDDRLLNPPPTGARKSLATAFIACFLVFQIIAPLTYYLSGRTTDERFAWRMFSAVILQRCKAYVFESRGTGEALERVNVQPDLHHAWATLLQRYPPPIVRKLLAWRCREADVSSVYLKRRCLPAFGTAELPTDEIVMDCSTGAVRELRGPR